MTFSEIELRDVSVLARSAPLVRGITMKLRRGESLALVGSNGAGKSTLLKTIMGIVETSSGDIFLRGVRAETLSSRQRACLLGYVPQSLELPFDMTVGDFVALSRYPRLRPLQPLMKQDEKVVREVMESCGLSGLGPRMMRTLSGGETKRVLLAAALVHEPDCVLLDEPFAGLDPRGIADVLRVLQDIRREWKGSLIVATHQLNLLSGLVDKVLALSSGRLCWEGAPEEFFTPEILLKVYERPLEVIPVATRQHPYVVGI